MACTLAGKKMEFDGRADSTSHRTVEDVNRVILSDSAVPASATAMVYNPSQEEADLYAFIRRHGLYSSTDGRILLG